MEQTAYVKAVSPDGTAQVACVRGAACSGECHSCGVCGEESRTVLFTARNPIGAKPGEIVTVRSGSVLTAAAAVYVLPLALFFLGYLLGSLAWGRGALIGCAAFALGLAGAVAYDRYVAAKRKIVYTITGYPAPGALGKEETDLD